MKYWLLTSEFPPMHGGGISTYCLETAEMLSENKHEVTVITQDYKVNSIITETCNNFRIVRFNPNKYYTKSFLGFETHHSYAFAQVVVYLIKNEGIPDII